MKKFSFVLLPILTFPAIAAACDNTNRDKAGKKEGEKAVVSSENDELKKIKDELQDEIDKALQKRDAYSDDVATNTNVFGKSAKVVQDAVDAHHKATTVDEVKEAIKKLKEEIKKLDSLFVLSIEEKQKIAQDDFDKALVATKEAKAKLTKPSSIEVLEKSIKAAESIKKGEEHYYGELIKWTATYQKRIDEAKKLEAKSDQELWNTYLLRETNIIDSFNREYNSTDLFDAELEQLKKLFKDAKANKNKKYKEQETQLRKSVSEILDKISKIAITASKAKELAKLLDKNGELIIGNDIKYILSGAFADQSTIKKVKFGENLEVIEPDAFDNSGVESIEFNNKLKSLDGFNNTKLSSLSLPKTLEKFAGFKRTKIDKITLPKSLKSFIWQNSILKEITFEDDATFGNVKSTFSFDGIVIDKQFLPSLEKIIVKDMEAKMELIKKLKPEGSDNTEWENIVQVKTKK
ncbi:leucine-rich repeat domain-containing protein [Mycoplasmopsis bovis]|uniref:leucine-rich repeat domain-containing protein n=1 Tax=Mycoplasmopsis bovis TaxID=28903 RepID=UPI001BDE1413|nr:leucine-rich repeat domain-containing protein [Mycoplasmopsis bovis]MBT1337439.1 leucine-rich repeat domain-containing protein [Mycoplasmopsis bovis]UJB27465.1 leucine-rich repeat domain-containing protein [Mycoplasmopsis bovis]